MIVGDAQWQEYAKEGLIWPEAGHSGVIVDGWHRDDPRNPLRGSQMTLKAHWTKYSVEPTKVCEAWSSPRGTSQNGCMTHLGRPR